MLGSHILSKFSNITLSPLKVVWHDEKSEKRAVLARKRYIQRLGGRKQKPAITTYVGYLVAIQNPVLRSSSRGLQKIQNEYTKFLWYTFAKICPALNDVGS